MKRAQRSLTVVCVVVFLAGVGVVLGGLGGATHVWRGALLVGIILSSHVNGLIDMALGAYLFAYHRAVKGRGENERLWWTLGMLFFLGGVAQVLGGGTPFLPRPIAIGLMILAITARVIRAGFAGWNFPNLRRDLKEEGKRPTRAELQGIIDKMDHADREAEAAKRDRDWEAVERVQRLVMEARNEMQQLRQEVSLTFVQET